MDSSNDRFEKLILEKELAMSGAPGLFFNRVTGRVFVPLTLVGDAVLTNDVFTDIG